MKLAGRMRAAIEVLEVIFFRHLPASRALQDWGRDHRFAGSSDRAAIGNLVFDVLRRKQSLAAAIDGEAPRALVLAVLRHQWGLSLDEIELAAADDQFGPGALKSWEKTKLARTPQKTDIAHIDGDMPLWLLPSLERGYGGRCIEIAASLAQRAPLDLRVNTLRTSREKLLKELAKFSAKPTALSPLGIRIPPRGMFARLPNVEAEPVHARGWFEIQDQSSQVAALLAEAEAGQQIIDLCAGAGGKSLAMAACMDNKGQIHAYDSDKHRLRPIFERIKRAGVRNIQVIAADAPERVNSLSGRADTVFIDAPCSGSGAWRRKPDAKWRFGPDALAKRCEEQAALLHQAAGLVRPGGRIVYVTCSILPEENLDQIRDFLAANKDVSLAEAKPALNPDIPLAKAEPGYVQLTPVDHDGDGFFIATLTKTGG